LNPETGDVVWHCEGSGDGKSSVFAHEGVVYMFGGGRGGGGSLAVRVGGEGDVNQSHVLWRTNQRGGVGTPVFAKDRIYMVSGNIASSFDPASGDRISQTRLDAPADPAAAESDEEAEEQPQPGPGAPQAGGPPQGGRGGGFGGGRGARGGGGFGNQDYTSPVVADGKLYHVARGGAIYVLQLGEEVQQLAANKFGSDEADFSASPAIADGQIFIRSTKKLYCVEADN
jgi:hypothetical protein